MEVAPAKVSSAAVSECKVRVTVHLGGDGALREHAEERQAEHACL